MNHRLRRRRVRSTRGYCSEMAQKPPYDETDSTVDVALDGGTPLVAGAFRFYFSPELWEWSAEAAQIHGYPAIDMSPTTDQVMSHKHPDDGAKMAAILDHVRRTHEPFNSRHRIVDVPGDTREVIVVGNHFCDRAGKVIGTRGFYIDVTPSALQNALMARERNQVVTEALADITERRAVIEQAKGMLMLVYRIDSSTAFDIMRWRSQNTNVKLRSLAQRLVDDVAALNGDESLPPRSTFDDLLLTAHERVDPGAAS